MNRLKSCPFCYEKAFIESNGEKWRVWHNCKNTNPTIHIITDWAKTRHDAVIAWNSRMVDNDVKQLKIQNAKLRQYINKSKASSETVHNFETENRQ